MYIHSLVSDVSIGHGSYLMSSNGYIWSNSNPSDNIKQNGFSFQVGSTVTVEFDPVNKKVIYTMEGDPLPHKYEQTIDLSSKNLGVDTFVRTSAPKTMRSELLDWMPLVNISLSYGCTIHTIRAMWKSSWRSSIRTLIPRRMQGLTWAPRHALLLLWIISNRQHCESLSDRHGTQGSQQEP